MNGTTDKMYAPKTKARRAQHDIRGIRYSVSEWGDADSPLLVLLHGWGDAGGTFQFFVDQLRQDWFVVAPDWRGFGRSSLRASSYWFPDYLADLDVLLDLYSPDKPVRLLGHSMGGNIGALYAGVMPERVADFVNVEGFGLRDHDAADAASNYRRWLEQSRQGAGYRSYDSLDDLAARVGKRSPRMSADKALFVSDCWGQVEADGKVHIRADPAHKLRNPVLYRRAEAEACWRQLTARVLIISGSDSEFHSDASEWLDAGSAGLSLPDAVHQEIAAAGHMIHFEQPAALAVATEVFLAAGDPDL